MPSTPTKSPPAKPASPSPSLPCCRICHENAFDDDDGGGDNPLLSPCRCAGSVAKVHRRCLEAWLSMPTSASSTSGERVESGRRCELCGFQFAVALRNRSPMEWLCQRPMGEDQRNLLSDLVCFLLLTPLAAGSAYLCLLGGWYYMQKRRSESYGLIFLAAFLLAVYFVWLGLSIRFHVVRWKGWRSRNQNVKLVELEEVKVKKLGNKAKADKNASDADLV